MSAEGTALSKPGPLRGAQAFAGRTWPCAAGRGHVGGARTRACRPLAHALRGTGGRRLTQSRSYVLLLRDSVRPRGPLGVWCAEHILHGPRGCPQWQVFRSVGHHVCVACLCVCFYAVSVSVTCIRRCLRSPGGPFQLLHPARSLEPGQDGARAVGTDPPRPWSLGLTERVPAVRGRQPVKRPVAHRV